MLAVTRLVVASLLVGFLTAGCRLTPRYTVTATPIQLLGPDHHGHCFAIDPKARALWSWEPGRNPVGCGSRSTGPGVTPREDATVTTGPSGDVEITFQLHLVRGGPRDVRLVLHNGILRDTASGEQVATAQRSDLNVPE